MLPVEELKKEHEAIRRMLDVLEIVAARLDAGPAVPADDIDAIVTFLRIFVDQCHHAKEEDVLFVAMEEVGVSRDGGPIGVMLHEHRLGRDCVSDIDKSSVDYRAGDRRAAARIAASARQYVALLRWHIEKENEVLYPLAEMHLPMSRQDEMSEEFERIENTRVGPGRHEAFHALLDRLAETYLP